MQQLHLVGFTTDHRSLIFSVRRGAKSGSYVVEVDDAFLDAVDGAKSFVEGAAGSAEDGDGGEAYQQAARPESALTVREVQARLRRGLSIEQVAVHAGVEPSWIARFAAPVLAEQASVVRAVRASRFAKARLGPSASPLGESVYRNLVDRGVTTPREELDRGWRARQLADGRWLVIFKYASRGRKLEAVWEYDAETRALSARDRLATQLAHRPGPAPSARAAAQARRPATKGTKGTTARTPARSRAAPASSAPEKAAAKRVASARKAARARMEAEAEKATRRNVKVARQAAKRPARARVIEPAVVEDEEPEEVETEVEELALEELAVEELAVEVEETEVEVELAVEELAEEQLAVDEVEEEVPAPAPAAIFFDDVAEVVDEPELAMRWHLPPPQPVPPLPRRREPLRAGRGDELEEPSAAPKRLLRVRTDLAPPADDGQAPPEPATVPSPPPERRRTRPLRAR
ncbi:MAG: hypothetical protein QOH64_2667 [Acidimicrobiaceae bacterium]